MTAATHKARANAPGFTFIELVVVVAILVLMAGVIIPIYRTSMNAVKVRSATRDFLAALTFVQEKAVTSLYEYRFCMDPKENTYWAERLEAYDEDHEKVFKPVTDSLVTKRALPDFLIIKDVRTKTDYKSKFPYIGCYPNGGCDIAEVHLDNTRDDERVVVRTKGFLGKIEVKTP